MSVTLKLIEIVADDGQDRHFRPNLKQIRDPSHTLIK